MTIPKKIFYCWFGGEKSVDVISYINNWKSLLPDYEIIEINENTKEYFDIDYELKNNLWFKTVYENKLWAYIADYVRIKVLYENGGIYFDTDIYVEKNIDELIMRNKLILGWQDDLKIAVGVIIAPRYDANIKKVLDYYNDAIWKEAEVVMPDILTKLIASDYKLKPYNQITENEDIVILPPEYFYPMPVGFKDKEPFITDNTYTVHWWSGSWVKPEITYFIRNKHLMDLKKLVSICFERKIIFKNPFFKIEKQFKKICIEVDFYYLFKFKYLKENYTKWLTLFLFGKRIKLWKVKPDNYILELQRKNNKCKH